MSNAKTSRSVLNIGEIQMTRVWERLEAVHSWSQDPNPPMFFCERSEIVSIIQSLFPTRVNGNPVKVKVEFVERAIIVSCSIRISDNHTGVPLTKNRIVPNRVVSADKNPFRVDMLPESSAMYKIALAHVGMSVAPRWRGYSRFTASVDASKVGYLVRLDYTMMSKYITNATNNFTRGDIYVLAQQVVADFIACG